MMPSINRHRLQWGVERVRSQKAMARGGCCHCWLETLAGARAKQQANLLVGRWDMDATTPLLLAQPSCASRHRSVLVW